MELSTDGSYWGVNSGGVFRKEYGNNKKEVWSASEVQNEQSATDSTLRDEDKSDNPTTPNGNVLPTSYGKDTTNSQTTNELDEKRLFLFKNRWRLPKRLCMMLLLTR